MNTTSNRNPEQIISDMGLTLPENTPTPIGAFTNTRQVGDLLYVSGQGPVTAAGEYLTGKVGGQVSVDEANEHAQLVGLNILSAVRSHCGSLSKVKGVVKLLGMVNATPEFSQHPAVIDGCSSMFHQVFGAKGVHARSAFGVGSLPNQITVEIEAIFQLES
jgi:enamine deaminase RidA (YjgF/YER057c/UK114 family)